LEERVTGDGPDQRIVPSCIRAWSEQAFQLVGYPPRRLVEVAKGFGTHGVLGSLCQDEPGVITGQLIRTIGEHLAAAGGG
jgi:hypothetical protein